MIWIGLTGGIGSGKSQVAACFSALNVPIIDADAISRQLTNTPNSSALKAIQQAFGDKAIDVSSCLNRTYIRQLVFTDKTAKQRLEAILHPLIMAEIHFQQSQFQAAYGLIEIPTLIENPHFQTLVSRILVVECNEVFRLQRVMKRNGLSEIEVRNIMANQATDEERLRVADDVIRNESSLKDLQQVVQKMHQFYCSLKNTES
ncbi:dephospho-CoA kinase [Kingella negevensis]|uniref:Dephospho-CoA kinase n=1 Tax=Kingella negevensis TaxID=1522312 RepID=A0A238TAY2_9NEIS|nr:dephospho-CoA kinase [Kingella negevensis]MDK4680961.1 dephospho-CoA kinase [Kingella negevensis]MDK4683163.1 dephospho-CoA kinase [Kingella negevensis]MDK4683954.1 dephospho-CoA kinase [Kingella negevensis]MDK4691705.1 dephospho-CoA kinase [Kingella negevensis]MDK4693143.1 dephospho-CoA kinase [Kingella negevensis]